MHPHALHVAFLSVPAAGHINPGLGLVAELVSRGHRVTYAVNAHFAARVVAAGATPLVYTSTPAWAHGPGAEVIEPGGEMTAFLDEAQAVLPQVEHALDGDRPDVLVYDIGAWPAPILAQRWSVPALLLSPTFVAYDGWEADFAPDPAPAGAGPAPDDRFPDAMASWLAQEGFAGTFADLMTPARAVVVVPRALHPRADTVAAQNTFVGPMIGDRSFQGTWAPADERPVLLVSFGSAYTDRSEVYRACVEAFDDGVWRVVLVVGGGVDPASLGELPAFVEVHREVPQVDVLARAGAFVSHGGMGGTLEALSHGVPIVAIPQIPEQRVVARRLEELGVGRHLPLDAVTAGALREAVDALTSDARVATALARMQGEIAASGGASAAADVAEEVAHRP